jgi:hypothetical protein
VARFSSFQYPSSLCISWLKGKYWSTVDVYKQSNRYQLCDKDKFPQSLIDITTSNTIRTPPTIPSSLSSAANAYVQFSVDNGRCEVFPENVRFQLDELQSTNDAQVKMAALPRTSVRVFPDSSQPVTLKVRRTGHRLSACLVLIH